MDIAVKNRIEGPLTISHTRLGELLVSVGALGPAEIDQVLAFQAKTGKRFGDAALALKLITASELQHALARQFEYPLVTPTESSLSPKLVAAFKPFDAYSETLRTLRSQLLMRWFGEHLSTLAFTAPHRDSGCSVLVANLAVCFAQLGERTLLVDADLRRPVQHTLFGLGTEYGLCEVLQNRCSALEAVQSIAAFPALSVLAAGTVAPNPQELLSRLPFRHALDQLAGHFDVILIDSPPLLECADAQIIAARAGGCVFVARRHRTTAAQVTRAKTLLTDSTTHILGSVMAD
jgi:protein-tyrosine kinase